MIELRSSIFPFLLGLVLGAFCFPPGPTARAAGPTARAAGPDRSDAGSLAWNPGEPIDVALEIRALVEADWVDQDLAYQVRATKPVEPSPAKRAEVTTAEDASGGCDGIKNGHVGFHTASGEVDPWWQVDLGRSHQLDRVVIYNRTDGKTAARTRNIEVLVASDAEAKDFRTVYRHNGETFYGVASATDKKKQEKPLVVALREENVNARVVRLRVPGRCSFALDEVEVYPADAPEKNVALGKPADQKSIGPSSYPGTRGHRFVQPAAKKPVAPTEPTFLLAHTREVLARGQALLARFAEAAASGRPVPFAGELAAVEARVEKLEAAGRVSLDARREVYFDARRLLRRIAFSNPLLDFDKLLFIKRHDPGGLYHMVHQYYGFSANPGGGLFVLCNPFSAEPKLVNLLEKSAVEGGRLAGTKLVPGTFLSPEVSYDGNTVLFAYTQGKGDEIEWSPRASYHLFRVNADGTALVQLTDGTANDFDPCFLPNGRIVFVSGRRGGYLRCGGSAPPYDSPTYTLHSIDAWGQNPVCLSFHETHEWHPSVDHHGMLVYTRWDYVDRDTNVAHHIWSCFPDGRDPRSYHGNYPIERKNRPWMEMSIRAVPGSNRYVATAAAHHGLAFGSLVLIDYRPEDDGAISQLERLTPDVPFPESEGGKANIRRNMAYGTAWPLGENDYLCVYDRHAKNRGIYWIDRDGNRELLYRDPSISCLSPMPLRGRRRPPVIPEGTTQTASAKQTDLENRPATIALMNVYDSDFPWPEATKISALRVIQVLPKTTPPVDQPRIGAGPETNARAVLGTVPVESDGSAFFEAPVGKLLYFQALDQRGMAVQSMRSGTYVHPGERLVCQGCHERKHRPPSLAGGTPLALNRAPSQLVPEVDGSNPFNYPRLVQPVLDRHCVGCHRQKKALDLSGTVGAKHGWTRSYDNLVWDYGFYFNVYNGSINTGVHGGSRTTAGQFGAKAAKLLDYLDQRHYGVKLPDEDFRRVALWLDCNSEFFGAYHEPQAQALGQLVLPTLD